MNSSSMNNCGNCARGKPHGWLEIWCRLFGIVISRNHTGCKYHGYGGIDSNEEEHDPAE